MIFADWHPDEDRLLARYLEPGAGDDTLERHLAWCRACHGRSAALAQTLDRLHQAAQDDADAAFDPARLDAQRQSIQRRLGADAYGKILPFPSPVQSPRRAVLTRVAAAADTDQLDVAGNLVYIGAYLRPGDEAVRVTAAAVDVYRSLGDDRLSWAVQNLTSRYAAAPGLTVLRVRASGEASLVRAAFREHRLAYAAALVDDSGTAHADVYATRDVVDALAVRGLTVDVVGDATADGVARQGQVGLGNRFAGGALPPTLGIQE